MKVKDMRQGSLLTLGQISVMEGRDPQPIVWMKANKACEFITEKCVNVMPFDAKKIQIGEETLRYQWGKSGFAESDLLRYLNGYGKDWWPLDKEYPYYAKDRFRKSVGFCTYFEEYELNDVIIEGEFGYFRIPTRQDILREGPGTPNLTIFNSNRGLRAKMTFECYWAAQRWYRGVYFNESSYMEYWIHRDSEVPYSYNAALSRSGGTPTMKVSEPLGVRPVCSVNPETEVAIVGGGLYCVADHHLTALPDDGAGLFELFGFSAVPA